MGLEKILAKAKVDFLPASKDRIKDYVAKYELEDYFKEDVPQEYRERFRKGLDRITDEVTDKYASELRSLIRTPLSKGSMALAVANDLSAYATATPFDNVTALGWSLFVGKSIIEAPALIRYFRKSKDWYGPVRHLMLKVPRYLIPVVGPALESGAFERMVKRRVRKEVKRKFIENYGEYVPFEERLQEKLKEPLRDNIYTKPREREKELVGAGVE